MKAGTQLQRSLAWSVAILGAFIMYLTFTYAPSGDFDRMPVESREEPDRLARVEILRQDGLTLQRDWVAGSPGRIQIVDDQPVLGGQPVALDLLRDTLDGMVRRRLLTAAIVVATSETPTHQVHAIVEECRKSRVRVVYIAYLES
ncbi:MAG: hypothetical protein U1F61_26830 [Opitutaceae bacterium]